MAEQRCPKCDGCGRVANSDDQEPWTVWEDLPLKSAAAVLIGLVRPITCPRCAGSGVIPGRFTSVIPGDPEVPGADRLWR